MADVTRRQALAGLGCFGAGFGLSGCASPIVPFCPGDPTISDEGTPLTIDVHKGKLSHRFFGVNAVNFLGLGPNQPARMRLDKYYSLSSKPAWMAKVDKLPPAIA